jgi:hypothetical protein
MVYAASLRRQVESQTGVNFRPVLAGVFLLGFRSISTIVDITIMVNDEKYYHANWIAIMVVFAVSYKCTRLVSYCSETVLATVVKRLQTM